MTFLVSTILMVTGFKKIINLWNVIILAFLPYKLTMIYSEVISNHIRCSYYLLVSGLEFLWC